MNEEQRLALRKIEKLEQANCRNCYTRASNRKIYTEAKVQMYCIDVCTVGLKIKEIGQVLDTDKNRQLRARWSEEEEFYLLNHYKMYPIYHLAYRLNRDEDSIHKKLKILLKKKENSVVS